MTPRLTFALALTASAALVGAVFAAPVAEGGLKFVKSLTG